MRRKKTLKQYEKDYERCRTCRFGGAVHFRSPATACMYLAETSKRRPCEPGVQCTVYEPLKEEQDGT